MERNIKETFPFLLQNAAVGWREGEVLGISLRVVKVMHLQREKISCAERIMAAVNEPFPH